MSEACRLDADFYRRCLAHMAEAHELDFVVANSLPIPYFGDLKAYMASPLRVLTAALNPSDREFPTDELRFEVGKGVQGAAELEAQLSAYFKGNPYRRWFSSFEPVLNGLEASYGGRMANGEYASTALHVDMCSPIATSPTWSKLTAEQRAKLTATGQQIFEALIIELKPHAIVASLGWKHLETWNTDFEAGRLWECIIKHVTAANGKPLARPLLVQVKEIASRTGGSFLFVNASAADKPFGRFTNERKRMVGEQLLRRLRSAQ